VTEEPLGSHVLELQVADVVVETDEPTRLLAELTGAAVAAGRELDSLEVVRPSLEDDAPYVDAALHGDGLTALQYRRTRGGPSDHIVPAMRGANRIRFERRGDRYLFTAQAGEGPAVVSDHAGTVLGSTVYVGLFLCSHNAAVNETATFTDVKIVT